MANFFRCSVTWRHLVNEKDYFSRHFCQTTDQRCKRLTFHLPRRHMGDSFKNVDREKLKIEKLQIFVNEPQKHDSCLV